jgi:predicted ATP-dependent endonuclease of OLD family
MKIKHIDIQNFRKLKSCRVDFHEKQTIFVGANNSGKTSAMNALMLFLKERHLDTKDFTLSLWQEIEKIGSSWLVANEATPPNLSIDRWQAVLPQLDVWLDVNAGEFHYVAQIIPTLDWKGGMLGVRLRYQPKDLEALYKDFTTAFLAAKDAKKDANQALKLWPSNMLDFLERRLHHHFEVSAYALDPEEFNHTENGIIVSQPLPDSSLPLGSDPFKGLIKIDQINAQRGFSDANAEGFAQKNLSAQLRKYFSEHLNPSVLPEASDIAALQAIDDAKSVFDEKLKTSFKEPLAELELLKYPGFGNPKIIISTEVNPIDGIDHASAVLFDVLGDGSNQHAGPRLPEHYNGLGYQNLISMVFKLISFRDKWMQVGKKGKQMESTNQGFEFEPLHLVMIEEPEAHLHAQVQQVFIREAYRVLRNHKNLGENKKFSTQLVVSTHSSHVAHEVDFVCLRYFKRKPSQTLGEVPTSTVVNLSKTFGDEKKTTQFAIRYLKSTHCDIFFADAAILVEGSAERMLVPHFIRGSKFQGLVNSYISILEIGGSHAHRLKALLQQLGLITLVITDLDSIDPGNKRKSIIPEKGKQYQTGNHSLRNWLPKLKDLDDVLNLGSKGKEDSVFPFRVAYQFPREVEFDAKSKAKTEVIPYTFEDALLFENLALFRVLKGTGLMGKLIKAANLPTAKEASEAMFKALEKGDKAGLSLYLLSNVDPEKLKVPLYISEGLDWLNIQLNGANDNLTTV